MILKILFTDDKSLELGANWIHGVLGNPIYELASTNGLVNIIQENKSHNIVAALPDGSRVPFKILEVKLKLQANKCIKSNIFSGNL